MVRIQSKYAGLLLSLSLLVVLGSPGRVPAQSKLPEGKGRELVDRECAKCHGLEGVIAARYDKDRWSSIVDDMVSRGATGTDQEIDQIIEYLSAHFGKSGSPAKLPKVNVNRATANELVSALEISEQDAAAIVRVREKSGNFKDLDDLKKVPGIDVKRLDQKQDRVEF